MTKITSRLTISSGDLAYDQLVLLKGDPTAIRRRLLTLIHMGVIAEASLSLRTAPSPAGNEVPASAQTLSTAPADRSNDRKSTLPAMTKTRKIPEFDLSGLPG